MKLKERFARWITEKVAMWTIPHKDELVTSLVMNTAGLELPKGEVRYLAPIKGTTGPIMLTGNSLPVFTYNVFDKAIMQFVQMTVEVARPERISFFAVIHNPKEVENHGRPVPVKPAYREPFERLSLSLFKYFPLTVTPHMTVVENPLRQVNA